MSAAASAFFRSGELETVAAFPELPGLRRARAWPMAWAVCIRRCSSGAS